MAKATKSKETKAKRREALMHDYGTAMERIAKGTEPTALTAKLIVAVLKIQYDVKVASNAKKADVVELLRVAIQERPLNIAMVVDQAQVDAGGESEGDEEESEGEVEEGEEL